MNWYEKVVALLGIISASVSAVLTSENVILQGEATGGTSTTLVE